MELETKSQFAARLKRDPAFVTRAIQTGKISGEALVGEGRSARIRVDVAMRQLGQTLDLGQQLAQAVPIMSAGQAELAIMPPASVAEPSGLSSLRDEQIRLRNEKLNREIERLAREEALAAGELVPVSDVRRHLGERMAWIAPMFDEQTVAVAKAIAEAHGLAYSELLVLAKQATRELRSRWVGQLAAPMDGITP